MEIFKSFKQHRFFIQCLSILVSALILISAFPINLMNVKAEGTQVWDGTAAADFAGGNGTEATPFLIENANQLYKMVVEYHTYAASNGKYFKITKDIYLNDVVDGTSVKALTDKKNWLADYGNTIATASKTNSFNGNLDGGNNTIYGLYVDGIKSAGLFPAISSYAVIENLSFENLYITGGNGFGGAIAGQAIYYHWNSAAKITNCSVVDATIGESSNIEFVGGFVGDIKECSVHFTNCYTYNISLSDKATAGGIVGYAYSGGTLKMTNCYSIGYFPTRSNNSKAVCVNVYTDTAAPSGNTTANVTVLTSEQMKGENAKQNMLGFDFDRAWKTVENGYPVHFVYVRPSYIWDGSKAEAFAGGTGTKADPFLISNGAQLYKMVAEYSNGATASGANNTPSYFKLTADIHLNDVKSGDLENPTVDAWNGLGFENWYSPANGNNGFCGELDGDGHTVYGLYSNGAYAGLIPLATDGAKICNLNLKNSYTNGTNTAGGIIGYVPGHYSLDSISVSGCMVDNVVVYGKEYRAGAMVGGIGYIKIKVSNCSTTNSKITAASTAYPGRASGMIGYAIDNNVKHEVTNCFTDASVHPVCIATDKENFDRIDDKVNYANVYTSATKNFDADEGVTYLTPEQMKGENAKQNMLGFDFDRAWKTIENDYPQYFIYVRPDYVWDGNKAEEFAGGDGTADKPFLIENGAQLYKMVVDYSNASTGKGAENTTTYFKLTKDIYLNDVKDSDLVNPNAGSWSSIFTPWHSVGGVGKGFCGNFDGDGHTVYGLFATGSFVGLIPVLTDGAKVTNLNLKNSFVNGSASGGSAGAIVGYVGEHYTLKGVSVSGCTIDNCVVNSLSQKVGGIIGGFGELEIAVADCSVTRSKIVSTNADNPHLASALIGGGWGNKSRTVTNCFTDSFAHPVTATTDQTNFEALTAKIKYTNVYTSAAKNFEADGIIYLSDEQMKGENAKTNMSGLDFVRAWKTVDGDYPVHIIYVKPAEVWDGKKAENFAGGKGTETDPYLIENGGQLYKMVVDYSNASTGKGAENTVTYFKLTKDIYLNDINNNDLQNPTAEAFSTKFSSWYSLSGVGKGFCGNFNGGGHTVYGLFATGSYVGLIPVLTDGGTVSNLYLKNSFVNGSSKNGSAGAIVGYVGEHYTLKGISVSGCTVDNSVVKSVSQKAGGIIGGSGELKLAIADCSVTRSRVISTNAENPNLASGLIGSGWGNVSKTATNCFTDGLVHPVTATTDKDNFNTLAGKIKYTNVYTSATKNFDAEGVIYLSDEQMKGEAAKTNMTGLDFVRSWKVEEGDYPSHIIYVRPSDIWNGKKADKFAGGKGTETDPYLIKDGAQLYKMVSEYSNASAKSSKDNKKTYFKLINDIHLNDINDADLKNPTAEAFTTKFNSWYSLSGVGKGFCGDLNGNGHTVYGLFGNGAYAGLIPILTDGGKVYNLYLKNSFINGSSKNGAAGGIVGYVGEHYKLNTVSVTGCTVENSVIKSASQKAGGIIGGFGEIKFAVADCSVIKSKVTSTNAENPNFASGLVGSGWGNVTRTVTNCFTDGSVHPVTATTDADSFNTLAGKIKYTNVYTSAKKNFDAEGITYLTDDKMKGENAKKYMSGLDYTRSWKTVDGDYPTHIIYIRPSNVWDGKKATEFAGGSGTAYDPYLIANGAQLYKMVVDYSNAATAKDSDNKTTYFKLTKDIYLNDVNANDLANPSAEAFSTKFNSWYSLSGTGKGFCGELDGDGHTVYGLFATGGFAGLIPLLTDGGCIRNLNLKNSFVNGSSSGGSSGGLVGYVGGHYTLAPVSVTYCTVDNTVVKGASSRVAGIIGGFEQIKITLSDCSVTRVKLTSTNKEKSDLVSAFIGNGWGISGHKISNCFTDSTVHPVAATTDKTAFNTMAEARIYTNVYTSSAKKFDVDGITYLESDSKLKGLSVNKVLKGFDFTNDWSAVSNDYPVIKKGAGNWLYDKTIPGEVWSGKLARVYAAGEGTKENPYIIKTGGHLALLANDALNGKTTNKYYKITEDIILNDTSFENWKDNANEWYTGKWAQAFRGHLDGGYHIVSGLYLNKTKDNYTGTDYYGGLFACIGKNAVIEKLGIVNSSLTFTDAVSQKYLGAFAGFVDQYDKTASKASYEEYPIIRECFADTTVFLEANSCGGFIGCATRPIRVEDSFFTGKVNTTARGLFGYSKMGYEVEEALVKNFYTADSKYAVLSNASYDNIKCENCYSSSAQDKVGLTRLFIDRMVGKAAKEYMTGFDFNKIWTIRADNETPGLKGFNSKAYSNVMSPEDIVISFETNCDLRVESITGKAYSKLTLPELTREGYIFEGWYSFPELDVPFEYDYFPTFNTILYAKWTLSGFIQDFEQYEDSVYDYHEGYEYYRPTTPNYSADYVHGGGKSMHRVGGSDEALDFLLFYEDELEVGRTYKMSYYVTTDQEKASVDMSLVHLDWPDVYCDSKGVDTLSKLDSLKNGEWQECTFTFVAKSKWIAVRTSGKDSVYFDDFILYTTGDAANVGADLSGGFNSLWIIVAVSAAVVVILGAGATVFVIKKRAKQK